MLTSDASTTFAVIDGATGAILRTGEAEIDHLAALFDHDGQDLIAPVPEGVSDDTHYWAGEDFAVYPPRPGDWAVWTGAEWLDPRTPGNLAAELAARRGVALTRITAMRGQARLAYITDLPGQDMLLTAKLEEARAYVVDPAPAPADYPLILSEVGITAPTALEVAQVFLNLNALWRQAAGMLDSICFAAQAAVDAAPDEAAIDAAVAALANALAGAA